MRALEIKLLPTHGPPPCWISQISHSHSSAREIMGRLSHLFNEKSSVKRLKSIWRENFSLLAWVGFLCDPKRCRLFNYLFSLILCASHFRVCPFLPHSWVRHERRVCRLNGKQNKRKLSISVVEQFLCHRKNSSPERFMQFLCHFSCCCQHSFASSLVGMAMINWLCLCFYLRSPTNNEPETETTWALKKPEAI